MKLSQALLKKRAQSIKLLAMDVDGVLTGGEVVVLESGEEIKLWNAKDRLGLALARGHVKDLKFAWITGRKSTAVARAAEDLGVQFVVQNCANKLKALEEIAQSAGLDLDQTAFIGDDLIDLSVLAKVGLSCCPADAVEDVKKKVHYVSHLPGGRGVARDVLELILKAQGKWDSLVRSAYR